MDPVSEDYGFLRIRKRLDSFSRTLLFDLGGMGASEGDSRDTPGKEVFDADLLAVLNTAGFQQPAVIGVGTSGPTGIHFAITHPDRVSARVLINTYAHYVREDDYQ
jgi:pimeloyl-ACP methyl ester carboxylesterase